MYSRRRRRYENIVLYRSYLRYRNTLRHLCLKPHLYNPVRGFCHMNDFLLNTTYGNSNMRNGIWFVDLAIDATIEQGCITRQYRSVLAFAVGSGKLDITEWYRNQNCESFRFNIVIEELYRILYCLTSTSNSTTFRRLLNVREGTPGVECIVAIRERYVRVRRHTTHQSAQHRTATTKSRSEQHGVIAENQGIAPPIYLQSPQWPFSGPPYISSRLP